MKVHMNGTTMSAKPLTDVELISYVWEWNNRGGRRTLRQYWELGNTLLAYVENDKKSDQRTTHVRVAKILKKSHAFASQLLSFVARVDAEELQRITALCRKYRRALLWSHVVILLPVQNKEDWDRLILAVLKKDMNIREVRAAAAKVNGKTPRTASFHGESTELERNLVKCERLTKEWLDHDFTLPQKKRLTVRGVVRLSVLAMRMKEVVDKAAATLNMLDAKMSTVSIEP